MQNVQVEQARREGGIHVHLYVADPKQLVGMPLHVHLHLGMRAGQGFQQMRSSGCSISIPGATAKVKVGSSANSGVICAEGYAPPDNCEEVFGKIYRLNQTLDDDPPGDAIQAHYTSQFLTARGATSAGSNFFFEQQYGNELPGALCSSSGNPDNKLRVWMCGGGMTVGSCTKEFSGVCAATTDCDGSGYFRSSGCGCSKAGERAAPRTLRVDFDRGSAGISTSATQSGSLLLQLCQKRHDAGELVWESVTSDARGGDWALQVFKSAARRVAVLASTTPSAGELSWFTSNWQPNQANRLQPTSGPGAATAPDAIVSAV
jgi:hypothetical protein